MERAKVGDAVRVHYMGRLEDGTVFDSSVDRSPLEFTLGEGMVIPGFEAAALGMRTGEAKIVTIPPEKGYGPRREELVMEVDRGCVPSEYEPQAGQVIQIGQSRRQMLQVVVADVTEEKVFLDANHPLAGKTLVFEIEMVEIVEGGEDAKNTEKQEIIG